MNKIFYVLFPLFLSFISVSSCWSENSPFQALPKAELHIHLGGSYPLDYLLEIATPSQQAELITGLDSIADSISYESVFPVFNVVAQIVNTEEKIENGTFSLCNALENDGVSYVEIRTGLKNFGNGYESYLQAVLRGINRASSKQFQGTVLLSLQRSSTLAMAKMTVDLALCYKDQGVIGIDISGDSTKGEIATIIPELIRAREQGLFLSVHMGEVPTETDQQLIIEHLKPHRIGHGVFLEPNVIEWILAEKIPLEVCLTSSKLVQMTKNYCDHPALLYFKQRQHPIVLCTDDPLLFKTSLSKEYEILSTCNFNQEEIEQIAKNSFLYRFIQ